jgi:hypothetical protein
MDTSSLLDEIKEKGLVPCVVEFLKNKTPENKEKALAEIDTKLSEFKEKKESKMIDLFEKIRLAIVGENTNQLKDLLAQVDKNKSWFEKLKKGYGIAAGIMTWYIGGKIGNKVMASDALKSFKDTYLTEKPGEKFSIFKWITRTIYEAVSGNSDDKMSKDNQDIDWTRLSLGKDLPEGNSDEEFTAVEGEEQYRLKETPMKRYLAAKKFVEKSYPGLTLQIFSAYRDVETQARLYKKALEKYGTEQEARKWVAKPGSSAHHTGGAIDVSIKGDGGYSAEKKREILAEALVKAGFVNYEPEPWHWEYGTAMWARKTDNDQKYQAA